MAVSVEFVGGLIGFFTLCMILAIFLEKSNLENPTAASMLESAYYDSLGLAGKAMFKMSSDSSKKEALARFSLDNPKIVEKIISSTI
jgi:hypothetical protein